MKVWTNWIIGHALRRAEMLGTWDGIHGSRQQLHRDATKLDNDECFGRFQVGVFCSWNTTVSPSLRGDGRKGISYGGGLSRLAHNETCT